MKKSELLKFQKSLKEKRKRILEFIMKKKSNDIIEAEISDDDRVESSIEKDLFFNISNNEELILDDIDHALKKIEKGGFGDCESCGNPVSQKRLKSIPWVRYCIACQRAAEK